MEQFTVWKKFVSEEETAALLHELRHIRDYKSGGRDRAAFSDDPDQLTLLGSSVASTSRSWTPMLNRFRQKLYDKGMPHVNFCLLNHYDNGAQSIKYHSDNERNSDRLIISVSLGASRTFRTYNKQSGEEQDYRLDNGDVVIMRENFNSEHYHCILPEPRCTKYRLNLTFRYVYPNNMRDPPAKPFVTPTHKRTALPAAFPFTVVERRHARAGDLKWKRWGSVGTYIVLTDTRATLETRRGGGLHTPDFYLRPTTHVSQQQLEKFEEIKCLCVRHFPRGGNFLPFTCSLTQLVNMYLII